MRSILHLSIPAFPVAVARVTEPALRQHPGAVAPAHSERALVQAVSTEARADGVREGMPVYRARRFCPALKLLPPDPALAGRAMKALVELTSAYTPLWEPGRTGRLYLDLTGTGRLLGPGRDAAARLEREIRDRLRLAGNVGVAANKLTSRIASDYLDKPGVCDVLRGSEGNFIGPLPVSVLPGMGEARTRLLLEELNLRRVEELARLSLAQLHLVFGPLDLLMQRRARGIDPSPVLPPRRIPMVAEEALLPREENDDALLMAEVCRLAERCGFRLRERGLGAGQLSFTLHYADGVAVRRSATLPRPESTDAALLAAAGELFRRACERRVRVKSMRLACGRLAPAGRQLDLFGDHDTSPQEKALQQALDELRGRYGMNAVRRGKSLAPGSRLLDSGA
ncbi:MAG: DNA polymerase IV [Desulfuromonas sp.]|uniref:DNA polymerase Y family protein n=1 Tax=Desulfuromonas sp. TaxID=892 RepID=UPI000CC33384|nr:DNA polymerase IV [Desulfuromonas sp.]PLX83182.1 MAG: DNA polymerase IV [Desulfuromonas sp.]